MSTTRQRVEEQRVAFRSGWIERGGGPFRGEELAMQRYPMPTYERPRTLRIGRHEFQASVSGALYWRHAGLGAGRWTKTALTLEHLAPLRELFERPTEMVEIP